VFVGQILTTAAAAGSASARTTIGTYGGTARAVIKGTGQYQGIRIPQGAHYVTVDGFEVYGVDRTDLGVGTTGVYIGSGDSLNANNVKISNCHVHDVSAVVAQDSNGIKFFGDDCEIVGCTVEDIPTDGIWGTGLRPHIHRNTVRRVDLDGRNLADALQLTGNCSEYWVHHNTLDRSNTPSKQVFIISGASAGTGGVLEYNTLVGHPFVSIETSCVYIDQPRGVVRGNEMVGCYRSVYIAAGAVGGRVYGNVCRDTQIGIQTANIALGLVVAHNTVSACSLYGVYLLDDAAVVKNNLFHNCGTAVAAKGTAVRNYNAYHGNAADFESTGGGGATDVNKVTTDPLLRSDYALAAGSPCIGAGTYLGLGFTDLAGYRFAPAPCIGAREMRPRGVFTASRAFS